MINEAIYTILSGYAPLIAEIPTAKMYPLNAPQETTAPILIYSIASTTVENNKDGGQIEHVLVEVDIYDRVYKTAHSNAQLVKMALNRYNGTINGVEIDTILFEGLDDRGYNADMEEYRVAMGFRLRQKL